MDIQTNDLLYAKVKCWEHILLANLGKDRLFCSHDNKYPSDPSLNWFSLSIIIFLWIYFWWQPITVNPCFLKVSQAGKHSLQLTYFWVPIKQGSFSQVTTLPLYKSTYLASKSLPWAPSQKMSAISSFRGTMPHQHCSIFKWTLTYISSIEWWFHHPLKTALYQNLKFLFFFSMFVVSFSLSKCLCVL